MLYRRPVDELIRERYSCRAYFRRRLEPGRRRQLEGACRMLRQGLVGERARFQLVELGNEALRRMNPGDFSLIVNPLTFIAGAIQQSPLACESYGYLLEHLVLKATDLGLGTCWLGYFDASFFGEVSLAPGELLPAVSVVGDAAEGREVSGRDRWEYMFFMGNFEEPISREEAGQYAESLEMVRLAPSSGNTQPWRIVKERGRRVFHFYKERIDRHYEEKRLHNIDLGIAMCHFELAARKNRLAGRWNRLKPEPDVGPLPRRTDYIISYEFTI